MLPCSRNSNFCENQLQEDDVDVDPDCTTVFIGNLPVGGGLTEEDVRVGLEEAGMTPNDIVSVRRIDMYLLK